MMLGGSGTVVVDRMLCGSDKIESKGGPKCQNPQDTLDTCFFSRCKLYSLKNKHVYR